MATAPQAVFAIPSGTGWSGSWKYTGGTSIQVTLDVPGAKLVANGWDALGARAFVLNVTDTVPDGKCAYVEMDRGRHHRALVLRQRHHRAGHRAADLEQRRDGRAVPRLHRPQQQDQLQHHRRALVLHRRLHPHRGQRRAWKYYDGYSGEDWGAWITIGDVDFDYFGWGRLAVRPALDSSPG